MRRSRLAPGVTVGVEDLCVSTPDGRPSYRWSIRVGTGRLAREWSGEDLSGPAVGPEPTERQMLGVLLGFLGACLESVEWSERTGREAENVDLFPRQCVEALIGAGVSSDACALAEESLGSRR